MERFLNQTEWDKAVKTDGRDTIQKWVDVPEKEVFRVVLLEQKLNQNFESYVLHYSDKDENLYKVFAPSHFIADIKRNRSMSTRPYFVSHGMRQVGTRNVAQFEITYANTGKNFEIFNNVA